MKTNHPDQYETYLKQLLIDWNGKDAKIEELIEEKLKEKNRKIKTVTIPEGFKFEFLIKIYQPDICFLIETNHLGEK